MDFDLDYDSIFDSDSDSALDPDSVLNSDSVLVLKHILCHVCVVDVYSVHYTQTALSYK